MVQFSFSSEKQKNLSNPESHRDTPEQKGTCLVRRYTVSLSQQTRQLRRGDTVHIIENMGLGPLCLAPVRVDFAAFQGLSFKRCGNLGLRRYVSQITVRHDKHAVY